MTKQKHTGLMPFINETSKIIQKIRSTSRITNNEPASRRVDFEITMLCNNFLDKIETKLKELGDE